MATSGNIKTKYMKLEDKLNTLDGVLKQYIKYPKYFDNAKCYINEFTSFSVNVVSWRENKFEDLNINKHKPYKHLNLTFCVVFYQDGDNRKNPFLKREPIVKDIDIVLNRYRSKLRYEMDKFINECMQNRVCNKNSRTPDRHLHFKMF